jgi:hypothetical protein
LDLQLISCDVALRFGGSFYDALYLALADASSSHVIYADRCLQSRIVGRFSAAFWISRYQPLGRF